jgi:flagellar biosynthetic protein FliR
MGILDSVSSTLFGPVWTFLCVLCRIGPVLAMMPPVQGAMIPNRVKVMLALMISASLSPMVWSQTSDMPLHLFDLVVALAKEMLLGALFGTSVMLVMACLQVGGQVISSLSSMEMAQAADPSTQETVSVIQQLMSLFSMAMFVLLGGHRIMIGACLDSFAFYHAGEVLAEADWLMHLHEFVGHGFSVGLRASAPAAIALLLANFVTALIGRTLPQLNIMAVGFNINVLVMMLVLGLTVASVGWVFQNELAEWVERTVDLFPRAVAHGLQDPVPSMHSERLAFRNG